MIGINSEYARRVRAIAKRVKVNNQAVLNDAISEREAFQEDSLIAAEVRRIADKFGVELEAAAAVTGELETAYNIVWADVDALNARKTEFNDHE